MAWGQIAATLIGAAAGAAAGAYQTKKQVMMKQNAALKALVNQQAITNQFTGDVANRRQTGKGLAEAHNVAEMNNVPQNDTTKGNYLNQFAEVNPSYDYNQGYNQGLSNQQAIDNANRSNMEALSNAQLKQAGIDYDVQAARNQATMSGIGNAIKTANTIGNPFKSNNSQQNNTLSMQDPRFANQELATSDENAKESPVNNGSGLPEADIEDSLRQLSTVLYKYKDPTIPGCDDEEHCGTTAQSLEKTDLFKDCVVEGEDGYKRVDQWKLQEALTAGIAQLQREIDELEGESTNEDNA